MKLIPVSRKLQDLKEILERVIDNYGDYLRIAQNGQHEFLKAVTDGESFVQHVKKAIA